MWATKYWCLRKNMMDKSQAYFYCINGATLIINNIFKVSHQLDHIAGLLSTAFKGTLAARDIFTRCQKMHLYELLLALSEVNHTYSIEVTLTTQSLHCLSASALVPSSAHEWS